MVWLRLRHSRRCWLVAERVFILPRLSGAFPNPPTCILRKDLLMTIARLIVRYLGLLGFESDQRFRF